MENQKRFEEESVVKLLISFSVPAIVGMLVNTLYNIIDRMYIGNIKDVGNLAITGVGVAMPIMSVILAFAMLIGVGTAARVSLKLGEGDKLSAEKHIGNAFTLVIIVSFFITFVGSIFLEDILILFGASKNTISYAVDYMQIILGGSIFGIMSFALNHSIRSAGSPKIAMLSMLIGAIINIILDPIFIFAFGLGVRGAAIATIISQSVTTVWVLHYFSSKKGLIRLKRNNLKLDKEIVLSIFSIGISPCSMQIAACMVQVICNNTLKEYGGDLAIGAMAIISSIGMIFLTPIFGINQGSQPIIGYNYGSGNYQRVKDTVKYGVIGATIIVTIGWFVIQFAPDILINLFNDDKELVLIARRGIRLYLLVFPVIGFQIISSNFFQSTGKAKISMFLSLLRQVILLIPCLLILPNIIGLDGVWLSAALSDLISSLITGILFYKALKNLNREKCLR